jgi:hypothetical protein
MDEYVLQMTNEKGQVIATESVRDGHHITSREEVEVICLTACSNAQRKFMPPTAIIRINERRISSKIRC